MISDMEETMDKKKIGWAIVIVGIVIAVLIILLK